MKLIECHVDNFGTLSGVTLRLSSGLNAFCLSNGQGKSTLCAFLKCMLYGLSESRRQSLADNERKHYLPWQGGRFGGSLTLRHEGHIYRITRIFGTKSSEDRMEVFDEQSGSVTHALGNCPGETLFGIDRDGFAACALFSERIFSPTVENESILARLGGEENEKSGSLAAALSRLDEERKLYEKRGGHGLLAQTEAEISRLTELRISNLQKSKDLKQRESDLIAAKAALSQIAVKKPKSPAADFAFDDARPQKRASSPGLLTFSVLLLLLSLALGNLLHPLLFLGGVLAAVLFFLSFSKKEESGASQKNETPEEIAAPLFEERYRVCADCERAYVEAFEAAEEAAYLAGEIEMLEKKQSRLSCALSDIKKTEALLTLAGRRYRESRTEITRERFGDALSILGETKSKQFKLGDHFSPAFFSEESYRNAEALSRGEKDRVSLSRSLAMLSAMQKEKRPPLLLDDPFLSYDDEHLEIALSALSTLAQEYQILYLTCSHSRMP